MLPKITQSNVNIFIPLKVAQMAAYLSKSRQIPLEQALHIVYSSQTYKQLSIEATKKWHEGWWSLYEDLQEEL